MHSFSGMPIHESLLMTVSYEDWSQVRSPARARRRRKLGHRQRVRTVQVADPNVFVINGVIHGHPETIKTMLQLAEGSANGQ